MRTLAPTVSDVQEHTCLTASCGYSQWQAMTLWSVSLCPENQTYVSPSCCHLQPDMFNEFCSTQKQHVGVKIGVRFPKLVLSFGSRVKQPGSRYPTVTRTRIPPPFRVRMASRAAVRASFCRGGSGAWSCDSFPLIGLHWFRALPVAFGSSLRVGACS